LPAASTTATKLFFAMNAIVARRARFDNRLTFSPVECSVQPRSQILVFTYQDGHKHLVFKEIDTFAHLPYTGFPGATSSHMAASQIKQWLCAMRSSRHPSRCDSTKKYRGKADRIWPA
jgi:hypothetical protein